MLSATDRTMTTVTEHVEGMLDRDQRTVRTRSSQHALATLYNTSDDYVHLPQPTLTTRCETRCPTHHISNAMPSTSWDWRTRKSSRTMWKIAQRLRRVLLVSTYLLCLVSIPRSSSAPASRNHMADRMNSHPKWINPCGMGNNEMPHDGEAFVVSDGDLLSQIVVQARIALSEADNFKEDYVRKTFNTDFEQNHMLWKTHRYEWLPNRDQIPKNLGEKTPDGHLGNLELDKSLLDTYEFLQTIAVGLEQIVWDQEDAESPFYSKFKDTEFKLRALLCEIQVAILERGLDMRPDVRRDVMTDEYRKTNSMVFRDWLIFRDYMNALEYVIEVFEYLKKNL